MKILKHIFAQPFVFATGLAALAHSTWALGTLFAGNEPMPQFSTAWFAWLIPAFLIAFALDIGQIVTSAEIRDGQRTPSKYLTFAVFATATYFLQWLYIIHHIPALELSEGVREQWGETVKLFRDCAIWIIPALLPLSTLLYTFSHNDTSADEPPADIEAFTIEEHHQPTSKDTEQNASTDEPPADIEAFTSIEELIEAELIPGLGNGFTVKCDECGWERTHASEASAIKALNAHKRYCNKAKMNGHSSLQINTIEVE